MPQYTATIALSGLNGTNGFKLEGVSTGDRSGNAVSSAGDINGDGFDDFIIGASSAGVAYVVFGKGTAFSSVFDFTTLDGSNGFRIDGSGAGDGAGTSVASAGDVNNDGFADIIVGAPTFDPSGDTDAGAAYVIYGKSTFSSGTFALSTIDGANATNGAFIPGTTGFGIQAGRSVGGGGDFNGDGNADLIVGAPGAVGGSANGETFVYFGTGSNLPATVSTPTGTGGAHPGVTIVGAEAAESGRSVAFIGDLNGDGRDDIIVGAPRSPVNGNVSVGSAYVIFGSNTFAGTSIATGDLNGSNGFRLDGVAVFEGAGGSVASAGDVNGDGIADLIIGGSGAAAGKAYVVFGKTTAFASTLSLGNLQAADGFAISGLTNFDLFGDSVASAGDVNGDGFGDIIVSARGATSGGIAGAGESYVIFGKASGFGTSFNLAALDGNNGFVVQGVEAGDNSGSAVASAGDINQDGLSDLLIGAPRASRVGANTSGDSYIVLGRKSDVAVNLVGTGASQTLVGSDLGDQLAGNGGNDVLWGHGGADTLNGGTGDDILRGGAGDDSYFIDSLGDAVIETSGFDTVFTSISDTLDAGVERLVLGGTQNLNGTGNSGDNTISGNSGNNILDGAGGTNNLTGGAGSDTFRFGHGQTTFVSDFKSRYFTATLAGANEVPAVVTAATGDVFLMLDGKQSSLATSVFVSDLSSNATGGHIHRGAAGVNGPILHHLDPPAATAFGFDSTWTTGLAADLANLIAGNLYVNIHTVTRPGGEIRGQIVAVAGDTGADKVDVSGLNIANFATIQAIAANDVFGTARISINQNGVASTLTLGGVGVANLTAADFVFRTSTAALTQTGTANADDLFGGNGASTLNGGDGADRLYGEDGIDFLNGGNGADLLVGGLGGDVMNGGAGVDTYVGGLGDDAYYVTNLGLDGRVEDIFTELANQGTDGVNTTVTLNLNEARYVNIENAYLSGTAAIAIGGSAVNNVLIGNSAANGIYGLAGRDIMRGDGGADVFHYLNMGETGKTATTRDLIQDFTVGVDKINVTLADANSVSAGNQNFTFLAGAGTAFTGVAGQVRFFHEDNVNNALDKTIVEFDVTGDRVVDFQIEMSAFGANPGLKALTAADFVL